MLVFFGYGSQLNKIFSGVGVGEVLMGQIVDFGNIFFFKGEGFIVWKEVINLCVVVLIIKELFNGNFVIVGCQEVKVNNELCELCVVGIICLQDIGMLNMVVYDKIVEVCIIYGGCGQISQV